MGEVKAVFLKECLLVSKVGPGDLPEKRVLVIPHIRRVDEFLCDLIEVGACSLNGGPTGCIFSKVLPFHLGTHDFIKMIKNKEKLGQFIQGLVIAAQGSMMSEFNQKAIAQPMDGGDPEFR